MRLRSGWIAAALLATTLAGCSLPGQARANPTPGAGPSFALVGLDGARHTLADYRGHVVLVNFWATWCIPCRAEMPELEVEYQKHRAEGVVFLGLDWKENRPAIEAFVDERRVTYPVLLDSDGRAYTAYQVGSLPETFVIDRQGRVAAHRIGLGTRDKFELDLKAAGA
ncbi:MAG: TlpA family protein disulfide reductase [Candidatus Dormibacteraeota bacterium]|nr:TlpA family protein disulfide reductase [Candidatus Dormibacteraeota bacterium]